MGDKKGNKGVIYARLLRSLMPRSSTASMTTVTAVMDKKARRRP